MTGNKHYLSTSKILIIKLFKNENGYLVFSCEFGGLTLVRKYMS